MIHDRTLLSIFTDIFFPTVYTPHYRHVYTLHNPSCIDSRPIGAIRGVYLEEGVFFYVFILKGLNTQLCTGEEEEGRMVFKKMGILCFFFFVPTCVECAASLCCPLVIVYSRIERELLAAESVSRGGERSRSCKHGQVFIQRRCLHLDKYIGKCVLSEWMERERQERGQVHPARNVSVQPISSSRIDRERKRIRKEQQKSS